MLTLISKWVLFNLALILSVGLPKEVEEATLHSVRLPPVLVQSDYHRLYEFFSSAVGDFLDEAEKSGISREEACHNILFAICFNSWGGFKILFPSLMKWIGRAGVELHTRLATEIRSATVGGGITMAAMEKMPLMKSVVYETLFTDPPVALQYGKAKKDFVLESHDAAYEVKEGEMLFGYQPVCWGGRGEADSSQPPLVFPRSVSPYVAGRKSHDHRGAGDDGSELDSWAHYQECRVWRRRRIGIGTAEGGGGTTGW